MRDAPVRPTLPILQPAPPMSKQRRLWRAVLAALSLFLAAAAGARAQGGSLHPAHVVPGVRLHKSRAIKSGPAFRIGMRGLDEVGRPLLHAGSPVTQRAPFRT